MPQSELIVDWCGYEAAEYAVLHWHYSKTMPASKLAKLGVWEGGQFIGAVIFGMGANNNMMKPYELEPWQGCELVRVALTAHQAPVTQIVAEAMKKLKRKFPGIKLIVSYADPSEGHSGGIYQAGNWIYTGTSEDHKFPIIEGKKRHPRTVSEMIKTGRLGSRADLEWVLMPGKHRYIYPINKRDRPRYMKLSQPLPNSG